MKRVSSRGLVAALLVSGAVLALTADERVFGLGADGRIMVRTAVSMATLGEIGIARGQAVDVPRERGDAVSRYGMGASLVLVVPALLAPAFERAFGTGASQTLFVLHQIVFVLLAAAGAGLLARAWGAAEGTAAAAALATALSSPLWAYVALDFSEPLQAALVGGALAAAAWAAKGTAEGTAKDTAKETTRGVPTPRRTLLLAALAGFLSGFALLSKSLLVVLFPAILAALWGVSASRMRRLAAACAGFTLPAALWLAFEVVRFGRPFASYAGESFNNPVLDGLWRLTVGPNKGLVLYFPLVLLAVWGVVSLLASRRAAVLPAVVFCAALLLAVSAWWAWDGSFGWGPRLLVPLVPVLAALAVLAPAPRTLFRVLFALGAIVNGIAALQPETLTGFAFDTLPPRFVSEAEAARYPAFAVDRRSDGRLVLFPRFHAARHAAAAPIPLAARLLLARLSGPTRERLDAALWRSSDPATAPAGSLADLVPPGNYVHLTAPFRWPHLGMSLSRKRTETDWTLAYVEALLDQALRAQDMGRADRAVDFGERLFSAHPNAQTATVLAEGYRLAHRPEMLASFAQTIRRRGMEPDFAVVLALAARDAGDAAGASTLMAEAAARSGRTELTRLAAAPPSSWPATLRMIQAGSATPSPPPARITS